MTAFSGFCWGIVAATALRAMPSRVAWTVRVPRWLGPPRTEHVMPWGERHEFMRRVIVESPEHPEKPGYRAQGVRVVGRGPFDGAGFAEAVATIVYAKPEGSTA